MVSAARAQYLKPTRGFQSNSFAFSLSSFALMGWLPMLESMPFILVSATDRKETCRTRSCDATTALDGQLPDSGSCVVRNHAGVTRNTAA
jgi:hypothetical protein